MANPPVDAPGRESIWGRIRRELRNPAMTTVIVVFVAIVAVPLAILVPSWVSTTQESLEARRESDALRDATILSASALVPSQIVPWMLDQVERMETADSPADWGFTSFVAGPCLAENLSQLPAGPFSDAIARGCTDLHQLQVDHASECVSIQTCDFSSRSMERLAAVRTNLLSVFADADFVLPYVKDEEEPGG